MAHQTNCVKMRFFTVGMNREMRVEFFEIFDCIFNGSEVTDIVPGIIFIPGIFYFTKYWNCFLIFY